MFICLFFSRSSQLMNSARSSSFWMIPGSSSQSVRSQGQSLQNSPTLSQALAQSQSNQGQQVAQHVAMTLSHILLLFFGKVRLPPKLYGLGGSFHIQIILPLLRVRHRPYSRQPMVEHFRPWPRSIRCCSTKVNKILEALQTRVDRILHSLQTGIHWDIPLQRCRRKSGMNGDKRFAMRGCLWLRNLDAPSLNNIEMKRLGKVLGAPRV